MSKEAEFITQWNGLLDYKIDEHNLRRPFFQFFYNALESLLRRLNFNLEKAKEEASKNPDPDRTYYIMFCGFVHRLYQLSDKTYNFFYFDLVNPTTKKSFHVLKMLFNYLKYYQMVKQSVCEKANQALTAYNDALTENNALQFKNETAKKRAARMEVQLDEYEKLLPEIRARVDTYSAEVQSIDKKIIQKNSEIKNFDSTMMKLEIKQTELSESLISEDDYKIRLNQITTLKQELNELRAIAEHVRLSNVGSSAKINELSRILDIINKVVEEQKLSHYDEFVTANTNLDTVSKKITQEEQRIKELKTNIKCLVGKTEEMLSKTKQLEMHVNKMQADFDAKKDELTRIISYHEKEIQQSNDELADLRSNAEELEQQEDFIFTSMVALLKLMTSSPGQLGRI